MDVLASPSWYQALTLKERVRALRRSPAGDRFDAAQAKERLDEWRRQPPFDDAELFARRLAADGITEEELARVLAEPAEAVGSRVPWPPAWLDDIWRAFEGLQVAPAPPAGSSGVPGPTLVEPARPLVTRGCDRLRQRLRELSQNAPVPFDIDAMVNVGRFHAEMKLAHMVTRTLALEVNVARLRGTLRGDTPEQRFRDFLLDLRRPERAIELLEEYPVLARQMVQAIDHATAFHLEFLRHLCADQEAIRNQLNGGRHPGRLVEVMGGAGDSHREGRSVLIARFDSGFKVVYKPRSLALDVHFQELLRWLDARGNGPTFRTIGIVAGADHGWVEFVEAAPCGTPQEVERFYQRQGAYVALLHALDAADFHTDNLVAAGEHPVLLDLEALFHARPGSMHVGDPLQRALLDRIVGSVLRIGLLPQRVWGTDDAEGVDVSGMGSVAGQMTPPVPQWQKPGTDEMYLGKERVPVEVGNSRPTLRGEPVDLLDHADAVCTGFTRMYRLLQRHAAELLAPDGPLARFVGDEIRVILRATQTYAVLLRESFHPDVLRDALERDKLFDRLWVPVQELPHLERAIPAEVEDLLHGDVPMFTTRPGSRDLWSSGGERLPEFLAEPSLSYVRRRIAGLGDAGLGEQLWFVRASLATTSRKARPVRSAGTGQKTGTASREELIAGACAVGDELERRALREGGAATWIGLLLSNEGRWSLGALGVDLYDGLPGVAMFLAYLAAITGEERYAALARSAIRPLRQDLPAIRRNATLVGAFTGVGGLVYAWTHLAALWGDRELLADAKAMLDDLPALVDRDEALDVIGGSAGCIGALLALHQHDGAPEALAEARRCGERLLATGRAMERGVGWVTSVATRVPYSGLSHGAAGMAWALLHLSAASGDPRFRRSALDALAYERTLFSAEHGNWWDLRETENAAAGERPTRCATTWCHGAPGIALARLSTLRLLDEAEVREEIRTAVTTTAREGFGDNHSLCHGDLGNLETLAAAASSLDDAAVREAVWRLARHVVDDIRTSGWRCGNPLGVESPGLMTGLAGIGYGLLRLADPERVPSVLLLESPRRVA